MGRTRDDGSQHAMWVATADLPQGGGHPFYERLNEILCAAGLDAFVEKLCGPFYARMGRSSLAPAMSEALRTVLRDMGAAGDRAGYEAAADRMAVDPFQSARVFLPPGTGKDAAFVLDQAHGSAYLCGMHDQQRGLDPAPEGWPRRTGQIRPLACIIREGSKSPPRTV